MTTPSKHLGVYAILRCKSAVALVAKTRGAYRGCWDLPGGSIEFGETPEAALRREIQEEVGVELEGFRLVEAASVNVDYADTDGAPVALHHLGIIYEGEIAERPRATDIASADTAGVRFFTRAELSGERLSPFAARFVRDNPHW